jgi:hypothetical protein
MAYFSSSREPLTVGAIPAAGISLYGRAFSVFFLLIGALSLTASGNQPRRPPCCVDKRSPRMQWNLRWRARIGRASIGSSRKSFWLGFLAHPNTDTVRKHSSVCHKADIPVWSTENGVFDRRHRSLQVRQGNWMR